MPHQRKCTKTKAEVTHPSKRITLPISLTEYQQIVADRREYRIWLDAMLNIPNCFHKQLPTATPCLTTGRRAS